MPKPGVVFDNRTSPCGPAVKSVASRWRQASAQMFPVHQVLANGMGLRHIAVAQFWIEQRLVSLQKIDVPIRTILRQPKIPDPLIVERKNHVLSLNAGANAGLNKPTLEREVDSQNRQ